MIRGNAGFLLGISLTKLARLTRRARRREVGGMQAQEIMPVRLKAFGPGSDVKLKNCVSYPLPRPFEVGELVKVVERDIGAVIVERDGFNYRVPLANVDPGSDRCLNGVWLDQWDRRVRKAEAKLRRLNALGRY